MEVEDSEGGNLSFEVLDPAPVGMAVTRGPDHRLLYSNAVYRSQVSGPRRGMPVEEAFATFVLPHYRASMDHVYTTGEPVIRTAQQVGALPGDPAPPERFFTFSLSRVVFGPGEHGVLVMLIDVTEQTVTERRVTAVAEQRRRILRRYESLVRLTADIFWVTSRDGYVSEPSPSWERMTGQRWADYRGQRWLRTVHPDDRAGTIMSWSHAVGQAVEMWEHVYRLRTCDGGYRTSSSARCRSPRTARWWSGWAPPPTSSSSGRTSGASACSTAPPTPPRSSGAWRRCSARWPT
ncbi:hypothetical protein GCM10020220_102530 [Nonomuraea rubra]|uniref:PAS domain-containing protein n=1 Tax=Nonomuraea rubra TaxID=46180 RepID=UPI0031E50DFE